MLGGSVERQKFFFEITKKRDQENLKKIIFNSVNERSTIVTDEWKGYLFLKNSNFKHLTVNHSKNFLNPDNKEINTQLIENTWKWFKKYIKEQNFKSTKNLNDIIFDYKFLKMEILPFEKVLHTLKYF